jgi:hypothetical protein
LTMILEVLNRVTRGLTRSKDHGIINSSKND